MFNMRDYLNLLESVSLDKQYTQSITALCGFNAVIDSIVMLNDVLIKKMEEKKESIFESIIEAIYKEKDVEIPIFSDKEYETLRRFYMPYVKENRWGGNAYYAYLFLKNYCTTNLCVERDNLRNNIVLEYKQGLKVKDKKISEDNRLILSDRTKKVFFGCRYEDAQFCFISGLHHVSDKDQFKNLQEFFTSREGFKHVELSTFSSLQYMRKIRRYILPYADVIGANAQEFKDVFGVEDVNDLNKIDQKVKLDNVLFLHERDNIKVFVPKDRFDDNLIRESVSFAQKVGIVKTSFLSESKDLLKNLEDFTLRNVDYHLIPSSLPYGVYETKHYKVFVFPTLLTSVKGHIVGLGDTISTAFSFYLYVKSSLYQANFNINFPSVVKNSATST